MEDVDLQKVTKMLERGGTMLAKHCECGSPMFKYQGRVVCPVCDSKRTEAKEGQAPKESTQLAVPVQTKPAVTPQPHVEEVKNRIIELPQRQMNIVVGGERLDESAIEAVVVSKMNDIAARLATEEYPDKIQAYMDIIESSLRILRELRAVSR